MGPPTTRASAAAEGMRNLLDGTWARAVPRHGAGRITYRVVVVGYANNVFIFLAHTSPRMLLLTLP